MPQMNLESITVGTRPLPPRLVIYGVHGIGKTTWAASAPAPIMLPLEDGLAALPVPTFPRPASFGEAMAALGALYTEPHAFQTLIVDTLDWLEPLVWAHTAFVGGKESIEDFGYGKGYIHAAEHWGAFLDGLNALRANGMTVICLAHAEIKRFDAPDTEPYDRYQIKLHKRAADVIQEWADVVGFAHYEVHTVSKDTGFNKQVTRGVGVGRRLLALEERPAYYAKNRYSLPAAIPFLKENGFAQFAAACAPAYAANLGAPLFAVPKTELPDMPAEMLERLDELMQTGQEILTGDL